MEDGKFNIKKSTGWQQPQHCLLQKMSCQKLVLAGSFAVRISSFESCRHFCAAAIRWRRGCCLSTQESEPNGPFSHLYTCSMTACTPGYLCSTGWFHSAALKPAINVHFSLPRWDSALLAVYSLAGLVVLRISSCIIFQDLYN